MQLIENGENKKEKEKYKKEEEEDKEEEEEKEVEVKEEVEENFFEAINRSKSAETLSLVHRRSNRKCGKGEQEFKSFPCEKNTIQKDNQLL